MIAIGTARRAATLGSVVLGLVVLLAGCGKVATSSSVEDQIKSQLGTDSADCPTDLAGEVGKSVVCKAAKAGVQFDVKVTVTSVKGDTINFDIERVAGTPAAPQAPAPAPAGPASEVAPAPAPAPAPASPSSTVDGKNVAQSVFDQLASNGKQVNEVSCPNLAATVGAKARCRLKSGADTYGVTVTVTSVQGTDVKFDIQVDQTPQ